MNHNFRMKISAYIPFAVMLMLAFPACDSKSPDAAAMSGSHEHGAQDGKNPLYQCAMHPNVVAQKPGDCPICGMALQPVKKIDAKGISGRAPVELTGQQRQLINIRTAAVEEGPVSQTLRAVGSVVPDETKTGAVNSRVMGWVEKLNVDTTGELVEKGQTLMAIYSPDLYSAQTDYLLAAGRGGVLAETARLRLQLLGISDEQIQQLKASGEATNTLELTAPLSGTVMEKNVVPAQMVQPGMTLYKIADLSQVWVQAEIYESELPFVSKGQTATVSIPAYPERQWEGTVDFIYPFLDAKTRTNRVRLVFDNPDSLLKPNMYVNVEIQNELESRLTVPARAVFDTGRRQYLFVEQKPGLFVPHVVTTGPRVGDRQVIRSGVNKGDEVVIDGNFLLDSESQLKSAASGPDDEMQSDMGKMDMGAKHPLPKAAGEATGKLMDNYGKIREALAADTIDKLAPLAESMRKALMDLHSPEVMPEQAMDDYMAKLAALEKALADFPPQEIAAARVAFGNVSASVIAFLKEFPPPLATPLQIVHCPMWSKSPADWLQTDTTIGNPFLGHDMPSCGEIVSTIEGGAAQ